MQKIAIQGYAGSFHDEASRSFFGDEIIAIPKDSFIDLAESLSSGESDFAVMAIENSIAGTILQNYRILREAGFWIIGEKYLRIKHQLCVCHGVDLSQIKEVHSHPMAINQCLQFLRKYPTINLIESEDTALSAKILSENRRKDVASISSRQAAKIYDLEILARDIETDKHNYTRFFMLSKSNKTISPYADKASIYVRIPDEKGRLLKVLQIIQNHDLNMSKLQSFPVLGEFRSYFFHLDIEFDHIDDYLHLKRDLLPITNDYTELGVYTRDRIETLINK